MIFCDVVEKCCIWLCRYCDVNVCVVHVGTDGNLSGSGLREIRQTSCWGTLLQCNQPSCCCTLTFASVQIYPTISTVYWIRAWTRTLLFFVVDSVCLYACLCHATPSNRFFFFVSRWNQAIFCPSVLRVALSIKNCFLRFLPRNAL